MTPKQVDLTARRDRTLAFTLRQRAATGGSVDYNATPVTVVKLQIKATRSTTAAALVTATGTAITNDVAQSTALLTLTPATLDNLVVGTYVYDVKVTLADGTTYTAMEGQFLMKDSVTT